MVDVSIRKFCPRIAFAGWIAIALGWRLVLSPAATFAAGVDFNFQIRPLLSDRCMACHGPDEKARKGKLRLDLAEGLFEPRTNGKRVVVKGSPKESELIRRIESTDPEELMPPPDSHLSLNADEKQILKSWIAEGGTWKQHWAFEPILGVIPPVARQTQWARNPIDHFILDRLEKAGLKPAPEADRERWLRRVTLDLTGLPPTVDEIDAFAKDGSVTAYQNNLRMSLCQIFRIVVPSGTRVNESS